MQLGSRLAGGCPIALLLLQFVVRPVPGADSAPRQLTAEQQAAFAREVRLIVDLVQNQHYLGTSLSAIDAADVLDRYVRDLDPEALLFTREDVAYLHHRFDHTLKSVYVFRGNLQPAFEVFDLMVERLRARIQWIDRRETQPFDLDGDRPEAIASKPDFLAEGAPLDARWTQRLREHLIEEILAGFAQGEAGAEVARRYRAWADDFYETEALAVRERFLNVLLADFDPHSGYFSADSEQAFDESMGATSFQPGMGLERREGAWEVAYLTPGSTADSSNTIERGDLLEAIAEGDEPWQEVTRMRYRELARRLRGADGSHCRVAWHGPRGGARQEAELVRTRSVVASQRARGAIWTVDAAPAPARVGWIFLPAFYGAGAHTGDAASASRDVHEILAAMQAKGVDGVVLDLRYNPGGTIAEAVALAGLFLESGSVTVTRGLDGKIEARRIAGGTAVFRGPLVVLVSEQSASASELLASALQDHRRAVVVGGAPTMGKGTLQTYVDLAAINPAGGASADWGLLRLTTQLFFRIDGSPIQRRGVTPDVVLPLGGAPDVPREEDLPLALPEETVVPPTETMDGGAAPRPVVTETLLALLRNKAQERATSLPEFHLWKEERELVAKRKTTNLGHSLAERWSRQKQRDAAWSRLRREHRKLAQAAVASALEWIDVSDVAAAQADHQRHLQHDPLPDGSPRAGRLWRGIFDVRTDDGKIAEVWVAGLPFDDFVGDTDALAQVAAEASGTKVAADNAASLLRAIVALPRRQDDDLLACVRRSLHLEAADEATVRRCFEALLAKIVELDGSVARPEATWDIPLRESLRIVSDWVVAAGTLGSPPGEGEGTVADSGETGRNAK